MDKSELKRVLKPLIKECIKEVIFEDGVLSGLITEVMQGLTSAAPIREQIAPIKSKPPQDNGESTIRAKEQLNEVKQKMQQATGLHGAFEGTTPMRQDKTQNSAHGPLRDANPYDPGVNIDGLVKMTGGWNQIK